MSSRFTIEGSPFPQGASYIPAEDAYNFSLYSKHATDVELLIYSGSDFVQPIFKLDLNPYLHKSQRMWHCRIKRSDIPGAAYYAYRVNGPAAGAGYDYHHFDPEKILLDPYAKAVFFPPDFDRGAAARPGANDGKAPLAVLPRVEEFDWQGDQHVYPESDLIIYEAHVRQFTRSTSSEVPEAHRGTYQGIIDKIPYLKELGITAIELMPIHQWDPQEGSSWGYMTLNFFAPHHGFSSEKTYDDAVVEFKTMVRELHKAGIAVILDVVYNHTTEGNHLGPNYSFKGIDNSSYYLVYPTADGQQFYMNTTGTGNTIHAANQQVRRLMLDSLKYWVREMHVDGFRFDIASIFARNSDGSLNFNEPPIFHSISTDPDLRDSILIAEPWDPEAYLLGKSFPGISWRQWNGKYRDEVKSFVKGDPGLVGPLAHRLYGSDHLFSDHPFYANHPFQSINYLASHDGYTLYDCTAYASHQRHTERNKSWNWGWEGDENVPDEIRRLRKQILKNYAALLFLSNGIPMFRAGDEFAQTQYGQDNPYNVDDETVWLDWTRLNEFEDVYRFYREMIAFRKAHPSLSRSRFWREDVRWYGDLFGPEFGLHSHTLAFYLNGKNPTHRIDDQEIYVMINAWWEPVEFHIQEAGPWHRIINTGLESPADVLKHGEEMVSSSGYLVPGRAVVVLVK